ncbi:MAG: amidohydrolase [Anaerolineales bacterium]|nr:amidohydrolase [Anaerolineales bacterium]
MTHADLLITNAKIFTADEKQSIAEAIAIQGNRILYVGANPKAESFRGPNTRVVDAQGRTVLPGLIDSHFHLLAGAKELRFAQLQNVRSLEMLRGELLNFAESNSRSEWIAGIGLVYGVLPDGNSITRHHLDAIIPDRPVFLVAYDGHTSWANTEALRRADLLNGRELGDFDKVVMGEDGLATGELLEAAGSLVEDLIPVPTEGETLDLLARAVKMAAGYGLTSVHNMNDNIKNLRVYQMLETRGEMSLRVYVPFRVDPEMKVDVLSEAVDMRSASTNKVRGGLVKFFMDGVIETGTGLLLDDYECRPGWRGTSQFEPEHFAELALEADAHGLQVAVHCTGDGAVRRVLDTYELVRKQNGQRDSRHRIEHIELVDDSDVGRFAQLGVIASMQPLHAPKEVGSPDPWPARVGPERYRRSFAWQTLRNAGAHLAFGSDWTVADMNPMTGIHAALNRTPWQEGDPNQAQTLEDVLLGYTRDAAYAEHMEHEKGLLKEGFLADVVMLSEDIFQTPKEEMLRVKAVLTICDGQVTHDSLE